MKKLLGSLLALAMFVPSGQANAELLKNFKASGQLDLQTQASRNAIDLVTKPNGDATQAAFADTTWNDRLNSAQTRTLVNLDWDLLDDVHAKVSLAKRSRFWGSQGTVGFTSADGNAQPLGTGANTNILGSVYVDQANVKIAKMADWFDVTLGRQYYGDSGDPIIYYAPSDKALYGMPTNALDAARVDTKFDWWNLWVHGIAGKQTGQGAVAATGRDIDVRGLKLGVTPMEGFNVDAFIYNRVAHAVGALGNSVNSGSGDARVSGLNDVLYVYGFKAKYEGMGAMLAGQFAWNGGDYRCQFVRTGAGHCDTDNSGAFTAGSGEQNFGSDAHYKGWMIKLDGSYKAEAEGIGAAMPWANLSMGSGRKDTQQNGQEGFTSIQGDFRPGTIYGRFAPSGAVTLGQGLPCLVNGANCGAAVGASGMGRLTATNPEGNTGLSSTGLNNRVIWGAGVKLTPAFLNQLTMGISFWQFRFQRATKTLTSTAGTTTDLANGLAQGGRNGNGNGNKHIGNELDFDFWWKHSDNVSFAFGVAGFKGGKYVQNIVEDARSANRGSQVAVNPVALAYGDFRIKF
jgi:hypothetical protein